MVVLVDDFLYVWYFWGEVVDFDEIGVCCCVFVFGEGEFVDVFVVVGVVFFDEYVWYGGVVVCEYLIEI